MKKRSKKSRIWWVIALGVFLLATYLNRSYAYFFDYLDKYQIVPPPANIPYILNDKSGIKRSNFVALGDSLTYGIGITDPTQTFPAQVADKITQRQPIRYYNLGEPGVTTKNLIKQELPQLNQIQPGIVVLEIGINDIFAMTSDQEFKQNYNQILDQLISHSPDQIVIVNIPYLTNPQVMLFPYNFLFDWRTRQLNSIINNLVVQKKDPRLIYVDLYSQTKDEFQQGSALYSADLFHPNTNGYKLWSEIIINDSNF